MTWKDEVAQTFIKALQATLAQDNRNASGKTSASLDYVIEGNEVQIWGLETFFYTEQGRKAGTPPPVSAILQWTIDKGIRADDGDQKGLAFAIRTKIAQEGSPTKNSPNNGRMQPLERTLDAVLPKLIEIAQRGIMKEVEADIFNLVKRVGA